MDYNSGGGSARVGSARHRAGNDPPSAPHVYKEGHDLLGRIVLNKHEVLHHMCDLGYFIRYLNGFIGP